MAYCDISKVHKDLFEKDFPTSWGVELHAKNKDASFTLHADRKESSVDTSAKVKHHCSYIGGDVSTIIASSGDAKVEVELSDKLPKGAKFGLEYNFPKEHIAKAHVEYDHESFNVKGKVNHDFNAKKTHGSACALFTHKEYSAGGAAHFDTTGLTEASFGARYKNDRIVGAARLHHKNKKLTADAGIVFHLQQDLGDIAGQVDYDIEKKDAVVHVGFSRTLSDGAWKAKVNSNAVASVSYTHHLNKTTKVTTAVEFDVLDPSKAKAGVHLKYSDEAAVISSVSK